MPSKCSTFEHSCPVCPPSAMLPFRNAHNNQCCKGGSVNDASHIQSYLRITMLQPAAGPATAPPPASAADGPGTRLGTAQTAPPQCCPGWRRRSGGSGGSCAPPAKPGMEVGRGAGPAWSRVDLKAGWSAGRHARKITAMECQAGTCKGPTPPSQDNRCACHTQPAAHHPPRGRQPTSQRPHLGRHFVCLQQVVHVRPRVVGARKAAAAGQQRAGVGAVRQRPQVDL